MVLKNPLDSYTTEAMLFHRKFRVAPGKLIGWQKLMGQERATEAVAENLAQIGGLYNVPAVAQLAGTGAVANAGAAGATCRRSRSCTQRDCCRPGWCPDSSGLATRSRPLDSSPFLVQS